MNFPQTPDDSARAPLPLELLRGGPGSSAGAEVGAREAEIARALEKATGSELSPEAIEALASEAPLIPPREPLGARLANYFGRHQLLLFVPVVFRVVGDCGCCQRRSPTPIWRPVWRRRAMWWRRTARFCPTAPKTEKRRAAAAALVTPAYDPNPNALSQALIELPESARRLRQALQTVRESQIANVGPSAGAGANAGASRNGRAGQNASASLNSNAGQSRSDAAARAAKFRELTGWNVAPATLDALLRVSNARWKTVDDAATSAVRAAYVRGRIRSDVAPDSESVRPLLRAQIETFSDQIALAPAEKTAALTLAQRVASVPNVVVNQSKTDDARRDARAAVLPVYTHIEANATLVRQGERISDAQWTQMQELGVVAPQFAPLTALAVGALCLMLVSGGGRLIIGGRAPRSVGAARRIVVGRGRADCVFAGVSLDFARATRRFFDDFARGNGGRCCSPFCSICAWACPPGFVVAALCALMARVDAQLFLAATLSAWIGALLVARFSSRFALLRAILILGVINGFLAGRAGRFGRCAARRSRLQRGVGHFGPVAPRCWRRRGLAIFLERPFGITSHLRLLELLSPDETVIRRMQVEAPGTYTHSLMVASLAEAAAKQVGADSLLCRVAGLYHDIGKLRRPHCFIENQRGDNIHDRLSPGLSALLIKAHVKDGLELGRADSLAVAGFGDRRVASRHQHGRLFSASRPSAVRRERRGRENLSLSRPQTALARGGDFAARRCARSLDAFDSASDARFARRAYREDCRGVGCARAI